MTPTKFTIPAESRALWDVIQRELEAQASECPVILITVRGERVDEVPASCDIECTRYDDVLLVQRETEVVRAATWGSPLEALKHYLTNADLSTVLEALIADEQSQVTTGIEMLCSDIRAHLARG